MTAERPTTGRAHGAERIWIHGDLHVENFGTYLNSDGRLIFDINDFDEAYLGRFTWDLQRFAASLALVGWQKALPEDAIRKLIARYARSYLAQVNHYVGSDDDDDFAIQLDNADGPVLAALDEARAMRRADLLDDITVLQQGRRAASSRTAPPAGSPREERAEWSRPSAPTSTRSRSRSASTARCSTSCATSSGSPASASAAPACRRTTCWSRATARRSTTTWCCSMKQANIPAVSRFVDTSEVDAYFEHEGHRTVVSQRALQVHTDPLLGHTSIDGVGYVVSEVSPYEVDLDWGEINEPDDMRAVVDLLGRATAKIHCASDEDSQQDLVDFQVEDGDRRSRWRAVATSSSRGCATGGSRTPSACARTTRCSSTPSARAGSDRRRPDAATDAGRLRRRSIAMLP